MEQYEQIKNPNTNRWIYKYGETYNELLKTYTPEQLDENIKKSTKQPKSPKVLKKYTTINKVNVNKTLTGLPEVDTLILHDLDDVYTACQTNKYLYKLCMADKQLKVKFTTQQNIHRKVDQLLSYLNRFPKYSVKIDWLHRPISYNRTGNYEIDGIFFIQKTNNNYTMTAHYIDHEDTFFNNFTALEIKNILLKIFYDYSNVNITLWKTGRKGENIIL